MEKDKQLIEKDDISYVSVFNPKPTTPKEIQLAEHKMWLRTIRKEYHVLDRTIKLIAGTWEGDCNSFSANIKEYITGVSLLP